MAEKLLDSEMMRRLEQLTMASRKMSTGHLKGERLSRRRGTSTEFADYRNYVPGDDLRFLDWKIYGRLEKLFLRQFMEEEDLRVFLLLDISTSMTYGEPAKLQFAKQVAAALGYICLNQMDSLYVHCFASSIVSSYGPKRGRGHAHDFFNYLENVESVRGTSIGKSLKTFAQTTSVGKGIVVVLSDFYDPSGLENGFKQLLARDFEVVLLHVLSPEERKPTLTGDIQLVDCEFDSKTDISLTARLLRTYDEKLQAFCDDLQQFVTARGGSYVLTPSDMPIEHLVLDLFCRRGMVQ